MKTAEYIALIAVMILTVTGCAASHGTSPKGLELPIEKAVINFPVEVSDGGYKVVGTEEFKKWQDDGKKMIVIGTLPWDEDRVLGVIPGSQSAPMPKSDKELTPEDKEHILTAAGNDKATVLVVYSGFVACKRSHVGAKLLVKNGYKNVYRYPAGITGWAESGYTLKKLR